MIRNAAKQLITYRTSITFLSLSLLSGGLNYLFYPMIARLLSVEEFGSSQALITLLTQIGSLFAGLSILSIYFIKRYGKKKATNIINLTQKIIIASLLAITVIVACFHGQISNFLNISDSFTVAIVAIDLALSIPFIVTFGVMLAEHRFIAAALLQLTVVLSKLILGAVLVPKFGSIGAIGAIGLSYVAGMLIYWLIARLAHRQAWSHDILRSYIPPSISELKSFSPYALAVILILVATSVLVILPGVDVIIARHHLDATTAGVYSAASTISSLLLFACMPVINILVPLMDKDNALKSAPQLKKAGALLTVIAVVSMVAFLTIPNQLLGILGDAYTQYANILWVFGLNMLFVCILTLLLQVIVLYKPALSACLAVITLILVITTITFNNTSGEAIIVAAATSYGIMVTISTAVAVVYATRRSRVNG